MILLRSSLWVVLVFSSSMGCRGPRAERTGERSEPVSLASSCPHPPRCQDAKTALICAEGSERRLACRGPSGCDASRGAAACDNVLAVTGDACAEEHDFACAMDRKAALECQAGVFRAVTSYEGVEGCHLKGDEIECAEGKGPGCEEIEDLACCLSFARRRKPH